MIIYENNNIYYIYIHIPKNAGKFIRDKIQNDTNNKIIKSYWGIKKMVDYAHIPYVNRLMYINNNIEYNYHTHCRNPYDRLISAFFYKNSNKNIDDFRLFCKNMLVKLNFNFNYYMYNIHYYPQYMFICDLNFNIQDNIKIEKLEECENPPKYNLLEYYDEECIKIVNKIYERDFIIFKYDKI
jgi:hypothetical protein